MTWLFNNLCYKINEFLDKQYLQLLNLNDGKLLFYMKVTLYNIYTNNTESTYTF